MIFTKSIMLIKPCPESKTMLALRKIHNIGLSILSLFMLISIIYTNIITNKLNSINGILCKPYDNNYAVFSAYMFLYSKYLEWGDTLFLHLSGKKISMLQYTHHMSTAFGTYFNTYGIVNPQYFIPMSLNCFIHVLMYWYFAYPRGILKVIRVQITQFQILQHIICILASIYIETLHNCNQNRYGNKIGLSLYFMYLIYFSIFYKNTYLKKIK